jgi:hypothetical protein
MMIILLVPQHAVAVEDALCISRKDTGHIRELTPYALHFFVRFTMNKP